MMKKKIAVFLMLLSVFVSCKNDDVDCSNVIPAPQEFFFTITDNEGNILIGTNAQYPIADIILLDDDLENAIFEAPSNDSIVGLRYYNLQSQQPYTLSLGADEDILILNIENGECGFRRIKGLTFNNTMYQSDETFFFTLIKN
jgi:hypothetical protein